MDHSNLEDIPEDDIPIEEDSIPESNNTPSAYNNYNKESVSNSKEPTRKNLSNKKGIKKKPRRSRLIINEDFAPVPEHKREIYDIDTKYLKSLENGVIFNNIITSSRFQLSKHFLKRKIKFNFEREEKFPSFFNVNFLPKPEMFPLPPTGQQRSTMNNLQMVKQVPNWPPQRTASSLPINQPNLQGSMSINGNNTNANAMISSLNALNASNSNNKGLFNVNANKLSSSQSSMNPPANASISPGSSEQKIIIPLHSSSMSATFNSNNNSGNQSSSKIIIPNPSSMPSTTSTSNPNRPPQGQNRPHTKEEEKKLLLVIVEKYKSDPERLRREYGEEKFSKIERILFKRGIIKLPPDHPNAQPSKQPQLTPKVNNTSSMNVAESQANAQPEVPPNESVNK